MARRHSLLLLLGLVAFLVAGAIAPHEHAGAKPGLWNAEHDLALMAAFGSHACQPDAVPALGLVLAPTGPVTPVAAHADSVPLSLADSRAPPRF